MITYLLSPQLSNSSDRENEWKAEHKDYRKRKGQNRKIRYVLPFVDTVC